MNQQEAITRLRDALSYYDTIEDGDVAKQALAATAPEKIEDNIAEAWKIISGTEILSIFAAHGIGWADNGIVTPFDGDDADTYIRAIREIMARCAPDSVGDANKMAGDLAEFAHQSAQGHLAARVDEAVELATEAIELMTRFHSHAEPDDTPDMNAVFPALSFKNFVDDHARLMFKLASFVRNPVEPAYTRLKKTADEVCSVLGHHGTISARDDRVSRLMDSLYETDALKSVYAESEGAQPVVRQSRINESTVADGLYIPTPELIDALKSSQQQADVDGAFVIVSRQALECAIDILGHQLPAPPAQPEDS